MGAPGVRGARASPLLGESRGAITRSFLMASSWIEIAYLPVVMYCSQRWIACSRAIAPTSSASRPAVCIRRSRNQSGTGSVDGSVDALSHRPTPSRGRGDGFGRA